MSDVRTSTGNGLTIGVIVVIAVVAVGAMAVFRNNQLPPDPFEGDEPRVVDCVADWESSQNRPIIADVFCQVGTGDNNFDAQDINRSPYTWSTTGRSGQVAAIYAVFNRETSGNCQIWVDGEFLDEEPIAQLIDEGAGPDNTDLIIWTCALEVTIL